MTSSNKHSQQQQQQHQQPPIMSRPPLIPNLSSPHSIPLLPSIPDNTTPYPSEPLPHFPHSLAPLPTLPDKQLPPRSHRAHLLQQHPPAPATAPAPAPPPPPPPPPPFPSKPSTQDQHWQSRILPQARVFPHTDFPLALLNKIAETEEKIRYAQLLPELMTESSRHLQAPALSLDMDGRLHIPGRKKDDNVLISFGFPKTDQDVDYCLEDTPGLSPANFSSLKNSLLHNLSRVRQAALECALDLENTFAQQVVFRIVTVDEYDRRMQSAVSRFCKSRKQILHKYRGYVRNRRWIENVATRQRRGCLTHRQNNILRLWLFSNFSNPYPDAADKRTLIQQTQLSMTQINNWLINARSRVWKPTVEVMSGERVRREVDSEEVSSGKEEVATVGVAAAASSSSAAVARLDFKADTDFMSSPEHVQTGGQSGVVTQQASHVTAMSGAVSVPSTQGHGQSGTQVESLTDEGTWLGPPAWGTLDFGSDVQLTNQLHG